MTVSDSTLPAPAPAAKNSFQRIAGVFFAPAETFADIARKPDILVPLLVILVIGFASTFLAMPKLDWDAMIATQMDTFKQQRSNMSDSDLARTESMMKKMLPFTKGMVAIGPALLIIGYLIIALIIWGACRLMGGAGDFKQAFSATLYAHFPRVVLMIIGTVVVMMKGSVNPMLMQTIVKSSVAGLANIDMMEQPVLFALLGSLEIFQIWTIVLLIIGFAALSKLSKGKTAAIVITLWLVTIVVKVGFAALGAMRMKS